MEFEGNKEEPGRWEELRRAQGQETTVVLPLAPYVTYQFRVIAVNEVGRSQPSVPSDHHETPPAGKWLLLGLLATHFVWPVFEYLKRKPEIARKGLGS